ncbi:hypothetical protein OnM2_018090 [Erysiphe neolycopersici]|uniref:Transposase IS30-like HTH domain-containing protein n=1 Tax=Erysiphe neolycopersici TaxID=212602 RepID=A0A420I403_9PEZI|nr:hypothetical protein OnM2_018090 [Erysiphe neolycopersici]
MNQPQTPPQSPRPQKYAKRLTRDKRLQVRTLAQEGLTYNVIAKRLDITHRQVQYAMNTAKLTPKKSSGRNSSLTSAQMDELENFITSSAEGRQMSYFEISNLVFPHLGVSEKVIEREMKKRSYTRRLVESMPQRVKAVYDAGGGHVKY